MKRMMIALAVAVLMASPAAAMDCGDPEEAGTQAWLDSCLLALADDSAFGPMEPFGPNWIVVDNQPCQVRRSAHPGPGVPPPPTEPVTWSGSCIDEKAHGEGRLEWRSPEGAHVYVGSMRAGLISGRGVWTWFGHRFEGQWRDSQPHGFGVFTHSYGNRYEGQWRKGCFGGVALFASRTSCGYR